MNKIFKKIFSIILYSLFFIHYSNIVYSQQITLSISPPLLKTIIKPGKSILIAYKIENLGDPAILKAKILPFVPQDNQGNIKIKNEFDGPIRFDLDNSLFKLDQPFFLKTKDSTQILLRIKVPDGAPNGDYYYTLLAETQPPPSTEGISSSRSKVTIGSNILITVTDSGNTEVKAKIALFDVLPRFKLNIFGHKIQLFDSNDKIPIILIVDNLGRNFLQPNGTITMRGNFGEKADFEIIPKNILAESQRVMSASPSAEIYNKTPVTLLLSGFFIGSYKLATKLYFGEGTPNLFASTSFIALPLKLILGLIITIFIAVLIVKKTTREQDN